MKTVLSQARRTKKERKDRMNKRNETQVMLSHLTEAFVCTSQ